MILLSLNIYSRSSSVNTVSSNLAQKMKKPLTVNFIFYAVLVEI